MLSRSDNVELLWRTGIRRGKFERGFRGMMAQSNVVVSAGWEHCIHVYDFDDYEHIGDLELPARVNRIAGR